MGWNTDDGQHEGWAASVLTDGAEASSYTAGHVIVYATGGGKELIPDDQVAGWRGRCSCGWQGLPWKRTNEPDDADWNTRRVYDEEGGPAPTSVEEAIYAEWRIHIAPHAALAEIRASAAAAASARRRLDGAALAARAAGASWGDIGAAAGVTRQSAQQRWGS